jgi:hypothetical protein
MREEHGMMAQRRSWKRWSIGFGAPLAGTIAALTAIAGVDWIAAWVVSAALFAIGAMGLLTATRRK